MPKRTICIQNPSCVSICDGALAVHQDGILRAKIPLDEVWVLILETHRANITTAALSKLVDAGIGVMLCGDDHMPNGLLLPLGAHSRHAAIVDDQLAISKPLKKRLWQRIVVAKILNQARVLDLIGQSGDELRALAKTVQSGDASGREAVAASAYFRKFIPVGTRREGAFTPALDYGYMVLRSGVGRTAVSGGWLVSRGLHHCNNLNAFNLVDDLIEPFRPVVDLMVAVDGLAGDLGPEAKRELASVFECMVRTPAGEMPVQGAIELELDTLKAAVKGGDANLLQLPEVTELRKATLE